MKAAPQDPGNRKPSRLWLWLMVPVVLQLAAWTAWFIIASHHPVAAVPLASGPGAK
ncbi:MAG: hypothetical protein RIQ93_1058 [Verrucomicrobiota bacterium]|jgi:hypothetical protein